jgi:hypothetical protein
MKKLIVLLMILLYAGEGWGQQTPPGYIKFELVFTYKIKYDNCSNPIQIDIPGEFVSETDSYSGTITKIYLINAGSQPIRIGEEYDVAPVFIHFDFPCMYEEGNISLYDCFGMDYIVKVRPSVTTLKFANDDEHVLAENKDITIVANYSYSAFSPMTDMWEFIIGEETYSVPHTSEYFYMNGNSLLDMLKMHNPDKPVLTYKELVDKGQFYVRHFPIFDPDYDCNSDCVEHFPVYQMAITPVLSAPKIVSVETIPPSCEGESDGYAVIHFSRAVYENELLQIIIEDLPLGESNPLTVPLGASTCTITGLAVGSRSIVLDGKYPYDHSY